MKMKELYDEKLTAHERTLLETMRNMMADSEVMETFDTSIWLKVDAELYNEVIELLHGGV